MIDDHSTFNSEKMMIFAGSANTVLAKQVCDHLKVPLGESILDTFSDGEHRFAVFFFQQSGGVLQEQFGG